jgi:uncharacterized membrane protein
MLPAFMRLLTAQGLAHLAQVLRGLPHHTLRSLAAAARATAALSGTFAFLRLTPIDRSAKVLVGGAVLLFVVGMALALTFSMDDGMNPVLEDRPPEQHVAEAILSAALCLLIVAGGILGARLVRRWRGQDSNG